MRFGRPEILLLLLALPAIVPAAFWTARRRRRSLERFGEPHLVGRLAPRVPWEWWVLRRGLLVAGLVLLLLALAEPKWGSRMENLRRRGVDIVIAIDTSASMLAEDIAPNRIERAKAEVSSFLRLLGGDRVALVPFAGTSYVHCPMTSDHSAVRLFLEILDTEILPVPGTALGDAIRTALRAFPDPQRRYQVIVLLTDGEDHDTDPIDAARQAADQGVRIYALGIGSPSGDLIPVREASGEIAGYKKNPEGQLVTTRLDEATLEEIARLTGGIYYRSTGGRWALESLAEEIESLPKREYEERSTLLLEHRYQFPLALGLLFLAVELCLPRALPRWTPGGRRRAAAALGLLLLLVLPAGPARAASAPRKVREGNRLYEEGEFEAAMKKYTEAQLEVPESAAVRFNLGNALYRQGKFPEAVEEYRNARSASEPALAQAAQYNIGNSFFEMGRLDEAVGAFERALRLDPDDLEAKRNLEIALARLQDQQQEEQQQEPQDGDGPAEREPPPPGDRGDSPPPDEPPAEPAPADRPPPEGMSREEALRLLEALQQDEKESLRRGLNLPEKRPVRGNDW